MDLQCAATHENKFKDTDLKNAKPANSFDVDDSDENYHG